MYNLIPLVDRSGKNLEECLFTPEHMVDLLRLLKTKVINGIPSVESR